LVGCICIREGKNYPEYGKSEYRYGTILSRKIGMFIFSMFGHQIPGSGFGFISGSGSENAGSGSALKPLQIHNTVYFHWTAIVFLFL
jgi:hypothetical protein